MPSAVENYQAAKDEAAKLDAEATLLADVVASAAEMLKRERPLQWRIGPAKQNLNFDGEQGTIDPTTWPDVQKFIAMKLRVKDASEKVAAAYAALSPSEKSFVQPRRR